MNESHRLPVRFYFALPRLLALLRGADPRRAEMNGTEAWVAGIATYVISYLFFAGFIPNTLNRWQTGVALVLLAFLVWLFWLFALYVNSLILNLLRGVGVFRPIPMRRGQSILVATTVTAMAFGLLQAGPLSGEIAAIWLIAVAMNLAAAMILAFRDGDGARA